MQGVSLSSTYTLNTQKGWMEMFLTQLKIHTHFENSLSTKTTKSTNRIVKGGIGLITITLAHVAACPPIFFSRILRSEALVYNSYFFIRTAVLRKLFSMRFSNKHYNFSRGSLLVNWRSHGDQWKGRKIFLSWNPFFINANQNLKKKARQNIWESKTSDTGQPDLH